MPWFYDHRIAGGDGHHRSTDRFIVTCSAADPRSGAKTGLPVSSPTDCDWCPPVLRDLQWTILPAPSDVIANHGAADSFAEIYWADKIMPFIGSAAESDESVANRGVNVATNGIYRCLSDTSVPTPYIDPDTGRPDGIQQRTSYAMNSLLSHKTRRYGLWTLPRFQVEVGLSNFVCFSERNAMAFRPPSDNDPRQDDYDIWLPVS